MKTVRMVILTLAAAMMFGCSDRNAAAEKAQQDAEAKARADAERKEMEKLPKVFAPRYNKRRDDSNPAPDPASTNP